jgi:hypothetical protein
MIFCWKSNGLGNCLFLHVFCLRRDGRVMFGYAFLAARLSMDLEVVCASGRAFIVCI